LRWVLVAVRERIFCARLAFIFATALVCLVGGAGNAFAQATSTVITAEANPVAVGQQVTLFATVSVTGAFVPGGTVEFFDGATSLGTNFVGAGSAIFNISSLALGNHSITGVYSGDTNGNLGSTSPPFILSIVSPPTVTAISPTSGPAAGGTSVTITGTGFTSAALVRFGGTSATSFAVNSDTSISAISPAGTGTIDITVVAAQAASATSAADRFTYTAPPPTVTSVSPTAGPTTGGTSVTITGTGFTGATAVTFGAAAATSFTVVSATSITATSPAGAGTVDVTVTTAGGTSAASPADQFTYIAQPTVAAISPTSGPGAGGTSITITGTGFSGATAVTFGGTAATTFAVTSATQITATAPTGTGTIDVRVTTAGGTSTTSAADRFTYITTPAVTSISPTAGPATGATSVTITGTEFSGATAVTFGAVAATSFTVNSSTSITATSPAGTGTVDVRVTTASGTSPTSAADQFTYVTAATVTSISPNAGPIAGGTSVAITGTGFTGATAVTFGATGATSFTVNSATSITATSPAGSGTVDVRVMTTGGTSPTSAADRFTYTAPPTLTSTTPTSGSTTGGTSLTITGTEFTGATAVTFGATAATSFTVNSATQITATSPAGTGTVDVRVTTPGGTSATLAADQFTYVASPAVTSISPTSGPTPGGTSVTITGTRLTGATAVKFGTTNATGFTVNSATSITATSPAGAGAVDITVTTAGGTSTTSAADQFTYNAAPMVTAVSPASGSPAGGTSVTITGANFTGVTAVKFGATNATSFTINSTTSITATTPAGTGTVDISVITASGTSAVSAADRFAYQTVATSATLASSVNPSNFGQAVTFTATVTGSGGTPVGTVTFKDAGSAFGTATLSGGNATFTISTLKSGTHTITAVYGGSAGFGGSTSAALIQTVNIPADSIKLRELQINVTKLVAQNSGQAISGAIDDAISEGFSSDWIFARPDQLGVRFNFAADPSDERDAADSKSTPDRGGGIFGAGAGNAYSANYASNGAVPGRGAGSRINNAFAAIDPQTPKKAPPKRFHEQQDWMFWIDVRGTGLDRLTSTTTNYGGITTTTAPLYGLQVNALAGLTYKLLPNFLVGALGGYENFNFTEQDINGRLTGDGWTIGSYLGWNIAPTLRYDAAMAYSGIAYNGTAGTAQGNFNGERWIVSTGLTGTYKAWGLTIEPSARVYALWENEGSYVDSLGTQQANHDFSTGRASGGVKLIYPFAWSDGITLAPYAGIYGDYYFDQDDATAIVAAGGVPLASTLLLDGWSARIVAGLGAKLANGAMLAFGTEYGGIGSDFQTWTLKGRGQLPFDAK
jgi:hypothetical protein